MAFQQPLMDSPPLRAGTGRCDITVEDSERPIRDRLFSKALVIDDGSTRIAIITMDAVAIGGICDICDDFLPQLRGRIERELGIPGDHLLVNASHTHPPGRILCPDEQLVERTFHAVSQAASHLCEVRVGAGSGYEDRIIMNRNLRLKDGRHWTVRHANPGPPDEEVAGVGPIDPQIGILRIDRLDGTPLAVVYNYACHLLFGDPEGSITANIPGIASTLIEECLGHKAMAFFLQGTAGDVIDIGFKDFSRVRDIEPFGLKLGLGVLKSCQKITTADGILNLIAKRIKLPRRNDIPLRVAQLHEEQRKLLESLRFTSLNFKSFLDLYLRHSLFPDYPAGDSWAYLQAESVGNRDRITMDAFTREQVDKYVDNLHAMERLAIIQDELATLERHEKINRIGGGCTIDAEIQGIRIGDFVLISAPLEVLTQVGLNIKKQSPHPHTYIAAFSNGYMHYGPAAADYSKKGYEVTECFLAPEWQAIFEKTAHEVMQSI